MYKGTDIDGILMVASSMNFSMVDFARYWRFRINADDQWEVVPAEISNVDSQ